MMTQSEAQLEQMKAQLGSQKLMQEAEIKKALMQQEFQYNMQLKEMEVKVKQEAEVEKEDRKDERTRIQASQQSEMIDQRAQGKPPRNFEEKGQPETPGEEQLLSPGPQGFESANDQVTGGVEMGGYGPEMGDFGPK
jgi:hypothetical protein